MDSPPITNLPDFVSENSEAEDVIKVFNHLFEIKSCLLLPKSAVVTEYVPDANYHGNRDCRPPGDELEDLPKVQRVNYGELFDEENGRILVNQEPLVGQKIGNLFGHSVIISLQKRLPERMRRYCDWIASDFQMILGKRLIYGTSASLLEDLLAIYSAGFFSYGWTGSYPDDVRLLVFPGVDGSRRLPA
jgi:hypothetical protein